MVPNSNLLLVVIDKTNQTEKDFPALTTEPQIIDISSVYGRDVVHPCHKLFLNNLTIRRLDECFVSWSNCCAHRVVA
jgi:hypothetical protein